MGCVMSTAIAVLLCRNKCSIDRLTSQMAFHPPSPASYTLETQDDGSLKLVFQVKEMADALRVVGHRGGVTVDVRLLRTKRRQTIPLFHFLCPGATTTLLWSHANAMDCGEMYFFFVELAVRLQVNIAAYDYSGYGAASGEPTEANAYSDALAVYNYLASTGLDVERQLVLYGQSIGSAPTLYLATRRRVAATVLHTPILSGLRFLIPPTAGQGCCSVNGCCSPICVYGLCDPFPNLRRIRSVKAPVLLIHGTADRTVDCSHTFKLYERLPAPYRREPYIIEGAGHENIVDHDIDGYFDRMREFLLSVPAIAGEGGNASPSSGAPTTPLVRGSGSGKVAHSPARVPSSISVSIDTAPLPRAPAEDGLP